MKIVKVDAIPEKNKEGRKKKETLIDEFLRSDMALCEVIFEEECTLKSTLSSLYHLANVRGGVRVVKRGQRVFLERK